MSTIRDPRAATTSVDDPFRYGWRYVIRRQPDGTEECEQVPLSLEDLLYPEEGDFQVHSRGHAEDIRYFTTIFLARLAAEPSALVLSEVRTART